MKFRHCPVHFLRKVGIPTLSKSIPTLRTEYISTLFPLYNSRIVRYNSRIVSRIGGQSRNSYFAQVQFRNRDSYFAQNIYTTGDYGLGNFAANTGSSRMSKFLHWTPPIGTYRHGWTAFEEMPKM